MRLLLQIIVALSTAALGILLAALLLPGFKVQFAGFLAAIAVYAAAEALLAPVVKRAGRRYAPALMGGIGVITTFVALLITSLMPGGIAMADAATWLLAGLIMWLTTSLGGWILLAILEKRYLTDDESDKKSAKPQQKPSTSRRVEEGAGKQDDER